jgi:DNA polymerase-3 subunit epsilon
MNLFVDIETTGFDYFRNDIISIAMILRGDQEECFRKTYYLKPESKKFWSAKAEEIHKISFNEACSFPAPLDTYNQILTDLSKHFEPHNYVKFVCHARNMFDLKFIHCKLNLVDKLFDFRKYVSSSNYLSTIDLAKDKLPHLDNFKLNTVCKYLDIKLDHHEAMSDANACCEIYQRLRHD